MSSLETNVRGAHFFIFFGIILLSIVVAVRGLLHDVEAIHGHC